jgi:hypothetical protein
MSRLLTENEDLCIQGIDGMDAFGGKYDAILRAVQDPAEPTGLFWQLERVAVIDPSTPSSSLLQSDMDLFLGNVDVSAAIPELATFPNVCLEFQGWDETDPGTMTWKYVEGGCQ